jgi:DNA repair protein RadA/Sms
LYISGEESIDQIKLRAERLRIKSEELLLISETNVEGIFQVIDQNNYSLIIIDSVQTLWTEELVGTAGSVGQVKESAAKLINLVKSKGVPLILVGQVTKEGSIAGPMTLAHMVDVALFLEGERYQSLRLLRGIKNRFGPTDEVGVFEMGEKGLFGVENPSEVFLGPSRAVPGSVTFCALEGTRPILVEIQALVTKSFLAIPRRVANGLDYNRLVMLTAVLQKSLNLTLWDQDLYLNIAGGFKIGEPAADLAVCLAIISSFRNKPLLQKTCAFGEVGLLGEVRRVSREEKREKEAKRLGFNKIITPKNCRNLWEANKNF